MRSDKSRALKLRLTGRSYNEINRLLGVPKATLSGWFTGLELPESAKKRIRERFQDKSVAALIKRNKLQTHHAEQRAREARRFAKLDIGTLSRRELFLIGVSLYWAEGYKRPIFRNGQTKTYHPVKLSNSDPELIKIYLRFLRECCKIPDEKIAANIMMYESHNAAYLINFWGKVTDISSSRIKTYQNGVSISSQRKKPYNILPYGTIQIIVNSTELYHKIMGWIEGLGATSF